MTPGLVLLDEGGLESSTLTAIRPTAGSFSFRQTRRTCSRF
jgi:hypothetical protein